MISYEIARSSITSATGVRREMKFTWRINIGRCGFVVFRKYVIIQIREAVVGGNVPSRVPSDVYDRSAWLPGPVQRESISRSSARKLKRLTRQLPLTVCRVVPLAFWNMIRSPG